MTGWHAILIPGAGVRGGGELPPWVVNRLEKAIELRGEACLVTLSAGTVYKPPPLDEAGFPILESVAGARYLVWRGVPPEKILVEAASYETIGNAWFARLLHTEPRGFRKLLVITSEFHLERAEAAFRWVFGLAPSRLAYELDFLAVPDAGWDAQALAVRREKERRGLERLLDLSRRYRDVSSFHAWLYSEHRAYSAAGLAGPHPPLEDALRRMY